MNPLPILAAFRHELRTVLWPGETLETLPRFTRRSHGEETTVTAHALDEASADIAIQEEIARGKPFEWKAFSFDRPPDLIERLARAGFEIGKPEALVVYDLAQGLEPFASDLDVRPVTLANLDDYRLTAEAAFGKDHASTTAALARDLAETDESHQAFVAYLDGLPAAVGRLYTHPESRFAGLYGGGTRPEFRGHGLYRAVVAARAHVAAARGARYLQVDAMPTSLPTLQRIGFVKVAESRPCTFTQNLRKVALE